LQRDDAHHALRESQRKLQESNFELQRLTNLDGLTGLSNRRFFDQYMETEWDRAIRAQSALSILMIDVDSFKRYNDTRGHLAGDEILKKVADTIQQNCRRSVDCAARFGGEEFVIALNDLSFEESQIVGEKVLKMIEGLRLPHSASSVGPYITVSIGAARVVPTHGESFLLLIDAADRALYKAKKAGRNRQVMAGPQDCDCGNKTY
jgi:two-component system chemotaxis family response regulator WspR